MIEPVRKEAVYEDLLALPNNTIGEIIDGELIVTPRPSPRHSKAASLLSHKIGPFQIGEGGGPGGWIILYEVEIKLAEECRPVVPDLSGWRVERFPRLIETNWIPVPPDWVCEVLSPRTIRLDRIRKMAKYARFGVEYAWLVDPMAMTLEVFKLEAGRWVLWGAFEGNDRARVEPFQEVEIALGDLWMEEPVPRG